MQAIILAGGQGTQLRPLTFTTPKALLPLINKPIIDYIIYILKTAGINEIIVTVEYLGKQIETYFQKNNFGIPITIHYVDDFQGSAQILSSIKHLLKPEFLVLNSDTLFDCDLAKAISFFKSQKANLGIITRKEKDILGKGAFEISQNILTKIISSSDFKAQIHFSDALIYYMKLDILNLIPINAYFDIHLDLIQTVLEQNKLISTYQMQGFWAVIGRIFPYFSANFWILQHLGTDSYIGAKSQIHKTATLIPPFFIDEECQIEANVKLGPNTILCKNVHIKKNTKIINSIIHRRSIIEENCVINNAVISDDSFIQQNSLLKEFSIIAQNTILGKNSILEKGVRIGPNLKLKSNTHVTDFLFPANSIKELQIPNAQNTPLTSIELSICAQLLKAGEQTSTAISSALSLPEPQIISILQTLETSKNIITSYHAQNQKLYTIKSKSL